MNVALIMCPMLCFIVCTTACGGQPKAGPSLSPQALARIQASDGVLEAMGDALETIDAAESFVLAFRYNPSQCTSPEFEVYVKGRWIRAYLEVEVPEATVMLNGLRNASIQGGVVRLNALPTTSTRLSDSRVVWPVVEVLGVPASEQETSRSSSMRQLPFVQSSPC